VSGIVAAFTKHDPDPELDKEILKLAWPAIAEMVLHTFIWVVDTAMVGRLGAQALSAVGLSGSVYWNVLWVFSAIAIGAMAVVARSVGAGISVGQLMPQGRHCLSQPYWGFCLLPEHTSLLPCISTWWIRERRKHHGCGVPSYCRSRICVACADKGRCRYPKRRRRYSHADVRSHLRKYNKRSRRLRAHLRLAGISQIRREGSSHCYARSQPGRRHSYLNCPIS
jgi:hypothetical protein